MPALLGLRIQGEKVVGYLLDLAHPKGGSKATFLLRFGFSVAQPSLLAKALAQPYVSAPESRMVFDAVGSRRIICQGPTLGVDGRKPWIRSVRLIEDDFYGRLLTVVPLPARRSTEPSILDGPETR